MEINTAKMQTELLKLKQLLKEYEENQLNLYNELSSSSLFWKDPHAQKFFDVVLEEKNKVHVAVEELNSLEELYTYLLEKYQALGVKIQFDLDSEDAIVERFNTFLNKINSIIRDYNALDVSFCPNEAGLIMEERDSLASVSENIENIKQSVKKTFAQIEEIEQEAQAKISKIKIQIVKETELNEYE